MLVEKTVIFVKFLHHPLLTYLILLYMTFTSSCYLQANRLTSFFIEIKGQSFRWRQIETCTDHKLTQYFSRHRPNVRTMINQKLSALVNFLCRHTSHQSRLIAYESYKRVGLFSPPSLYPSLPPPSSLLPPLNLKIILSLSHTHARTHIYAMDTVCIMHVHTHSPGPC